MENRGIYVAIPDESSNIDNDISSDFSSENQHDQKMFNNFVRQHFIEIKSQNTDIMESFDSIYSTEKYYEWPQNEIVSDIVDNNKLLSTVYKIYEYRHNCAFNRNNNLERKNANIRDCHTFLKLILSASQPVPLQLPSILLWGIIDDFVSGYKYDDIGIILDILNRLTNKSNIKSDYGPQTVANEFPSYALNNMLRSFSLVQMLRIKSLQGHYSNYEIIKQLETIKFSYPRVGISLSYYIGFVYMMMRRYNDAISTFSSGLLHFDENEKNSFHPYQNDQINKQTEKMYRLLLICLLLCPQNVDESIRKQLCEKNYPVIDLLCGGSKKFDKFFKESCPMMHNQALNNLYQWTKERDIQPCIHSVPLDIESNRVSPVQTTEYLTILNQKIYKKWVCGFTAILVIIIIILLVVIFVPKIFYEYYNFLDHSYCIHYCFVFCCLLHKFELFQMS